MTDHTDLIARLRKDDLFWEAPITCRSEAASALEAAQAEIERLTADRRVLQADGKHPAPCAKFCEATAFTIELRRASAEIEREKECTALAVTQAEKLIQQRNAALARLAELTKQEPVMVYDGRGIWDCGDGGHQDVTMLKMIAKGTKLYAAAGASPVQPVQGLQSVADALTIEQLNDKVERLMAVQPSQAGDAQDAARYRWLRPALTRGGNVEDSGELVAAFSHLAHTPTEPEFDSAIDAAINAKESK